MLIESIDIMTNPTSVKTAHLFHEPIFKPREAEPAASPRPEFPSTELQAAHPGATFASAGQRNWRAAMEGLAKAENGNIVVHCSGESDAILVLEWLQALIAPIEQRVVVRSDTAAPLTKEQEDQFKGLTNFLAQPKRVSRTADDDGTKDPRLMTAEDLLGGLLTPDRRDGDGPNLDDKAVPCYPEFKPKVFVAVSGCDNVFATMDDADKTKPAQAITTEALFGSNLGTISPLGGCTKLLQQLAKAGFIVPDDEAGRARLPQ